MFWSGQSLEELYTALSRGRTLLDGVAVRRRHARVEALGGRQHPRPGRHPAARREGDGRHHQPRDGAARPAPAVPRHRRLDRAVRRPVRHGVGHHDELPGHRRLEEHQPGGGGAGHRRGAVCHRARPAGGHPGGHLLQQVRRRLARGSASGSRPSPTSSRPSCRARSTCAPNEGAQANGRPASNHQASPGGGRRSRARSTRRCTRSTSRRSST